MHRDLYRSYHRFIVDQILAKSNCLIMAHEEFDDEIMGFIVYQPQSHSMIIHYLYVKLPYRNLKIGSQLCELVEHIADRKPICISHKNRNYHYFRKRKYVYNPYLMFINCL